MVVKNNIKYGFTLAEVLITLGIIGVVAALTLPVLNQKLSDQKNMASLKKIYSVLQQATNLVTSEFGFPEEWTVVDGDQEAVNTIYEYYKPHFIMVRECQNTAGCWAYPTKNLNGSVYWGDYSTSWFQYSFSLADGVNVLFDIYDTSNIRNFGVKADYPCLVIWVDVNGDRLPNQIGRDIFAFLVTHRGLVPAGINSDEVGSDCNMRRNGWSCTAKIIRDGWKIKYLKK